MKIKDIVLTRHRIDLPQPFFSSWDPRPLAQLEATIVRVIADEDIVGIGSGDAMIGFERFKDVFIGKDPFDFDLYL